MARTNLNVKFAFDCLEGNEWNLDRALANFNQVKVRALSPSEQSWIHELTQHDRVPWAGMHIYDMPFATRILPSPLPTACPSDCPRTHSSYFSPLLWSIVYCPLTNTLPMPADSLNRFVRCNTLSTTHSSQPKRNYVHYISFNSKHQCAITSPPSHTLLLSILIRL